MGVSKSRASFIRSLHQKKYRKQEQRFLVEGAKSVLELLYSDFKCEALLASEKFISDNQKALGKFQGELLEAKPSELQQLSDYKTNDSVIAIAKQKENKPLAVEKEFAFVLDDIRDPGNLGTIIRTCDWYGISKIIASNETAEFYNGKVIQATMGSFTRVEMFYTDLESFLDQTALPVLGTFLDGENVHRYDFGNEGLVVIGNEANGISKGVERHITTRITIPRFGSAESLNAAIATAVLCDNIRRPR